MKRLPKVLGLLCPFSASPPESGWPSSAHPQEQGAASYILLIHLVTQQTFIECLLHASFHGCKKYAVLGVILATSSCISQKALRANDQM